MAERVVARRRIVRVDARGVRPAFDSVAGEEPLEIRVDGVPVSVTMRTPGNDFELAMGFCLAEGIVDEAEDVASIRYCGDDRPAATFNVVDVRRRVPAPLDQRLRRNVSTTSACGVCGTTSIDVVRRHVRDLTGDEARVAAPVLARMPDDLRRGQRVFERTGGLHAAALATPDGEQSCLREDVGRHNAVDKVIGWAALTRRLPLCGRVLVVSGRVAFEIVQKAAVAGIPVIAAVSAPTSLAVELAESVGITLAGFVRDGSMNLYSGAHRVVTTGGLAGTRPASSSSRRS